MAFNVIGVPVMLLSFVLPIYAIWFWVSWYKRDRHQGALWRRVIGFVAAALGTFAIAWRYIFPLILQQHYLRVGSEDQVWWALSLWSIRVGVWVSLAGVLLGVISKGRTRIFSAASSVIMALTYFVLFALR